MFWALLYHQDDATQRVVIIATLNNVMECHLRSNLPELKLTELKIIRPRCLLYFQNEWYKIKLQISSAAMTFLDKTICDCGWGRLNLSFIFICDRNLGDELL